jgi:hypothetical protein
MPMLTASPAAMQRVVGAVAFTLVQVELARGFLRRIDQVAMPASVVVGGASDSIGSSLDLAGNPPRRRRRGHDFRKPLRCLIDTAARPQPGPRYSALSLNRSCQKLNGGCCGAWA